LRVCFAWLLVFVMGLSAACAPTLKDPKDRTPVDPGPPPGPEWDHCPPPIDASDAEVWNGLLEVTNGAVYCQRPQQYDDMARALLLRKQMRLMAGRYRLPTKGEDHVIDVPFCLRDEQGPIDSPTSGTASAGTQDFFMEGLSWWVRGTQPHGTEGAHLNWMTIGSEEDPYLLIDGSEPFSHELQISYCDMASCDWEDQSLFTACDVTPNTCDRFEMEDGDALSLDQYHWVGPVGGGFANITEARGTLSGQSFTVSNPAQLIMSYGHHAFTRSATVFFDTPIQGACGLFVDEATYRSTIWTVDCDGTPIDPLVVTNEVHEYQQGPCP